MNASALLRTWYLHRYLRTWTLFPELPIIWPEPEPPPYIETVDLTAALDFLLETELATEIPHHWRRLKLYRHYEGGDTRFRMVITVGDQGQHTFDLILYR
jgi:hypothetical protein